MDGKDLYLNVCEALNANALNIKNKHERTVINEAKKIDGGNGYKKIQHHLHGF